MYRLGDNESNSEAEEEEDEEEEDDQKQHLFRSERDLKCWLRKHGKSQYIDFEDDKKKILFQYFKSLDGDGSESIGVDELEDPLIALGLVKDRQQVERIIQEVDDDGTGAIEFPEFLKIISLGKNKSKKKGAFKNSDEGDDKEDYIGAIVDW